MHMYIHQNEFIYKCIHVCILYIDTNGYIYIYILCVHVNMRVHIYIYMYICIYTHTNAHINNVYVDACVHIYKPIYVNKWMCI